MERGVERFSEFDPAAREGIESLSRRTGAPDQQDLAVTDSYMPLDDVFDEHGLIRTKSAMPPPTADGMIRIVEIKGLDRQACGGTHLASTGQSPPVRILKIDNKGRHNRRIKIGLAG